MSALTEFLLTRIAEDEEVARGAVRWSEGASQWADDGEPDWQHIARWDPARVLAKCAADRRIVEDHGDQHDCTSLSAGDWPYVGCTTLRLLALPYAAHPDYRREWRP